MIDALFQALSEVLVFQNLIYLVVGTVIGLVVGMIPGLGGVAVLTMMLPFVIFLEPQQAMLLMISFMAVGSTSDTLPAVLIGVPGSMGAQATVVDGYPMAQRGEAGRALGAAYTSSMLGGIIGAVVLMLSIPLLRGIVLSMGPAEMLMVSLFGITLIGSVSGKVPYMGIAMGVLGILLSQIGMDAASGIDFWSFRHVYLLDGVPLIPILLGLFAIPELLDLVGRGKSSIADKDSVRGIGTGTLKGMLEACQHWFIIVRGSMIGIFVGIVPGLGGAVVDWLAYAHVKQTARKDRHLFGTGDIRGVIAPESANNAKDGGALIPTIGFGIPGSTGMVIVLTALLAAGIRPGPEMLTTHLNVTLGMIWTLVIANILAVGIMLVFSRWAIKLCFTPLHILAPVVITLVFFSGLRATNHTGDIVTLVVFSMIGWFMKRADWPRAPLILGLVLGPIIYTNLFISQQLYGFEMFQRTGVIIVLSLIVLSIVYTTWTTRKELKGDISPFSRNLIATVIVIVLLAVMFLTVVPWPAHSGRMFIQILSGIGLVFASVHLAFEVRAILRRRTLAAEGAVQDQAPATGVLSPAEDTLAFRRQAMFMGWVSAYAIGVWLFGIVIATGVFVFVFMLRSGSKNWVGPAIMAGSMVLFLWGLLHEVLQMTLFRGELTTWILFRFF